MDKSSWEFSVIISCWEVHTSMVFSRSRQKSSVVDWVVSLMACSWEVAVRIMMHINKRPVGINRRELHTFKRFKKNRCIMITVLCSQGLLPAVFLHGIPVV